MQKWTKPNELPHKSCTHHCAAAAKDGKAHLRRSPRNPHNLSLGIFQSVYKRTTEREREGERGIDSFTSSLRKKKKKNVIKKLPVNSSSLSALLPLLFEPANRIQTQFSLFQFSQFVFCISVLISQVLSCELD